MKCKKCRLGHLENVGRGGLTFLVCPKCGETNLEVKK